MFIFFFWFYFSFYLKFNQVYRDYKRAGLFFVMCEVEGFTTFGYGKAISEAKWVAASKMLEKFQLEPHFTVQPGSNERSSHAASNVSNSIGHLQEISQKEKISFPIYRDHFQLNLYVN